MVVSKTIGAIVGPVALSEVPSSVIPVDMVPEVRC